MGEVIHGDCREVMRTFDAERFSACVTDPPYALTANKKGGSGWASVNRNSPAGRARIGTGFMGKSWDAAIPSVEFWLEVRRVLKPGAHLVAFGGTSVVLTLALFRACDRPGVEVRKETVRR